MKGKKLSVFIVCLLCACLLLTGCSKLQEAAESVTGPRPVKFTAGEFEVETTSHIAIVLEAGETQLLDELTNLKSADFSGSACVDEIVAWSDAHPDVKVTYTVTLPDGTVLDNSAKSLDFSKYDSGGIAAAAEVLRYLPDVESIELGRERSGLGWGDIELLRGLYPEAKFKYVFDLYGVETDLQNTQINLSHIPVTDGGAYIKQVMAYMPNLAYVDTERECCGFV